MRIKKFLCILSCMICGSLAAAEINFEKIDSHVRDQYIKEGQVWHSVDVATMDIMAGPQSPIAVPPDTEVTCRYVEWNGHPPGTTPKFRCTLESGETVYVRYGKDNRKVYSKVAASRLFWALGFYVDEDYPVRLKCLGCPEKDPYKPARGERRIERDFGYALIERKFPGVVIEEHDDQGWMWSELNKVDVKSGGASEAQIDALKLLGVFVQHADNDAAQQRVACFDDDIKPDAKGMGTCTKPILMIGDLGSTFGAGAEKVSNSTKMDLKSWKSVKIWNLQKESQQHERVCMGYLTNSKSASVGAVDHGLSDPVISEAGRAFLAKLLDQLTDKQIEDLFRVARADRLPYMIKDHDVKRHPTIDDWVSAFKKKRQEIDERHCPS